jgi:hypothetical protein
MEYLADTVTIIRHFSGTGRIGRQAKSILEGVKSIEITCRYKAPA